MGTFSLSANTQYLHQWGNYDNPLITGTGRVWGKPAWQTSSPYKNRSSQAWEKLKIFKRTDISARVKDSQRGRQVRRKTRIHILQMTFLSLLLASHSPFRQKHRIHFTELTAVPQCPSSSSSPAPHLPGEQERGKAQGGCTKTHDNWITAPCCKHYLLLVSAEHTPSTQQAPCYPDWR